MARKLILASAVTLILAGTEVSALGLGGLRTDSALNQPFVGEIQLNDIGPDEVDAIKASLASREAFEKAGIERYYYLTGLVLTPEISANGQPVLRVSSRDPIREPYLDFLIEVVWPSGKLTKEYTVLLDPPVMTNRRAPGVRAPGASMAAASGASPAVTARGRGADLPSLGEGFPIYVGPVRPGANLSSLARGHATAGATVAQTAMALYRNNQHAFIRGNVNRLLAGASLIIPTRSELLALSPADAEREFAAAIRGRRVSSAPLTAIPPEAYSSRLRIAGSEATPRVPTPPGVTPTQPASPTAEGQIPGQSAQQDALLALEASESARQETAELRDRIKELEAQLAGIQTLLQLRNSQLARLQDDTAVPGVLGERTTTPGDLALDTGTPATPGSELAALEGDTPGELQLEDATASLTPGTETPATVTDPAAGDTGLRLEPLDGATSALTEGDAVSTDIGLLEPPTEGTAPAVEAETQAQAATEPQQGLLPPPLPEPIVEQAPAEQAPAEPKPKPAEPPVVAPPVTPAPTFWETWQWPIVGGGAGVLVALLGGLWWTRRRRGEVADEDEKGLDTGEIDLLDSLEPTTEPRHEAGDEAPSGAAASARSDIDSLLPTSGPGDLDSGQSPMTLMSSLSNFDAETDEADVLSEADIYMAYGRYSEAQDLLRNEMSRAPNRADLKLKLAESYGAAKNLPAMRALLDSIRESGGDVAEPDLWRRVSDQLKQLESRPEASDSSADGQLNVSDVLGSGLTTEPPGSLNIGVDESFSLDISDLQRSSDGSSGRGSSEPSPRTGEAGLLQISDDLLGDLLAESDDQQTAEGGGDSFGDALTVQSRRGTTEQSVDVSSDLVLSLDDPGVQETGDLDSIFDSLGQDEPTLVRDELGGARPSGADPNVGQPSSGAMSLEPDLPGDQESVPTDLLSSQWQMDSGIWDETATKLDLARAYIEMDDKDAAREILEEVTAEGRDEQVAEARALLQQIA